MGPVKLLDPFTRSPENVFREVQYMPGYVLSVTDEHIQRCL
jgi:hypothetical protein